MLVSSGCEACKGNKHQGNGLLTKPTRLRAVHAFVWVRKRTLLAAVAVAAIVSFSVLTPKGVHADTTASILSGASISDRSAPPKEPTTSVRESARNDAQPVGATVSRHATRGDYLARTALSYRGAPYRFGGRSRSGFDCSGFVQTVCSKWGLLLPRAAGAQIHKGVPVPIGKLQPGDLVFFKNTYKHGISHVGIYIGENRFIHASRPGVGVVISRLDKGYHKQHFASARRLNLSKLPPVPGEEQPIRKVILEETSEAVSLKATPAPAP